MISKGLSFLPSIPHGELSMIFFFWVVIYSSLYHPLPILLILLNLTLRDENPEGVAHCVSVPVFPNPPKHAYLLSSAPLCFYSSLAKGERFIQGDPWA